MLRNNKETTGAHFAGPPTFMGGSLVAWENVQSVGLRKCIIENL